MAVPEAPLEQTEQGVVCKSPGWFVVNVEDVRWRAWPGLGVSTNLGGDALFEQLGIGITVLGPGEPDFVHCPPQAAHVIVGGPCAVLGVGSREGNDDDWGAYVADPAATRLGAAPAETTGDFELAYARFPAREFTRYGGWLDR